MSFRISPPDSCLLRNALVLAAAECKDEHEDRAQKNKTDRKSVGFSEGFREFDLCDDHDDDVGDRDEQEQELPAVAPGDLEQRVDALEQSQDVQDGAIEDIGTVLSDMAEG